MWNTTNDAFKQRMATAIRRISDLLLVEAKFYMDGYDSMEIFRLIDPYIDWERYPPCDVAEFDCTICPLGPIRKCPDREIELDDAIDGDASSPIIHDIILMTVRRYMDIIGEFVNVE